MPGVSVASDNLGRGAVVDSEMQGHSAVAAVDVATSDCVADVLRLIEIAAIPSHTAADTSDSVTDRVVVDSKIQSHDTVAAVDRGGHVSADATGGIVLSVPSVAVASHSVPCNKKDAPSCVL